MSQTDPLEKIPDLEAQSSLGSEGTEPIKFVRVSIPTHTKLSTLGRIFTNVYGRHYSHNDTIAEMLSIWEAESGNKL